MRKEQNLFALSYLIAEITIIVKKVVIDQEWLNYHIL